MGNHADRPPKIQKFNFSDLDENFTVYCLRPADSEFRIRVALPRSRVEIYGSQVDFSLAKIFILFLDIFYLPGSYEPMCKFPVFSTSCTRLHFSFVVGVA